MSFFRKFTKRDNTGVTSVEYVTLMGFALAMALPMAVAATNLYYGFGKIDGTSSTGNAPLGQGSAVVHAFWSAINSPGNPTSAVSFNGSVFINGYNGAAATLMTSAGQLAGVLNYSNTTGVSVSQTVPNFLTITDVNGGTFNYTVNTVLTQYSGAATSLYLSGTLTDSTAGVGATAMNMTMSMVPTSGPAGSESWSMTFAEGGPLNTSQ